MKSIAKGAAVWKALSWNACYKLHKTRTSKMARKLEISLFISMVESLCYKVQKAWKT